MVRVAKGRANASRSTLKSRKSQSANMVQQSCGPEERLKSARLQVLAAMPDIIEAFIEEAKGGSCQHAKFLMEFAVDEPETEKRQKPKQPTKKPGAADQPKLF